MTGVQTCALPISPRHPVSPAATAVPGLDGRISHALLSVLSDQSARPDPNGAERTANGFSEIGPGWRGLRPLLGNSVFMTNGDTWLAQRRIIDSAFAGGRLRDVFSQRKSVVLGKSVDYGCRRIML